MTDSLIERMTEIAHRDSAVSVTVRADDLRALLSKLRAYVAGEAQKPVAWFIDWPDEPELGHYIAESPAVSGRNRPLVLADASSQESTPISEEPVYAYRRKGLDDFVTCDRQRFDELSAKPRLFETRIFYAAPQAARASASVAGEAAERLDAPAQVGGTRFGKGIHWSTVIQAAQRHHQYMQDPAREAERIAQAKKFQALVAGDSAPQAGPVAGEVQPVAYRAWFDQDNGARWLFTLWPEEERLDVQWQPLYAAPQASEAVRDAARLNWLLRHIPGDAIRRAVGVLSDTSDVGEFRQAIDAALSAQPGAQKDEPTSY